MIFVLYIIFNLANIKRVLPLISHTKDTLNYPYTVNLKI
jgi:hypothetical protein